MMTRTKLAVAAAALLLTPFTAGYASAAPTTAPAPATVSTARVPTPPPDAPAPAEAPAQALTACEMGGPHTDFRGTSIHMRNSPGGDHVGWANQGDCAYWYQTDSGPTVQCPDGSRTAAWQLVQNKRTGVVGYVSACYLG
ncbi:hypothetical protein ABT390_16555 [Streptomyces aurantiacus]|uniref:Secreted protein n=1 Tax=Streptomyces aurantiacus JA 4570 TaxID=1286094 RepID=S3ZC84_9ACTN|nr:hypothetical protein [Streptomyces aurantiacus]EPH40229.1 hypothetical protein STRAU_6723 [Streptomyces aurantiacus JA 4570]